MVEKIQGLEEQLKQNLAEINELKKRNQEFSQIMKDKDEQMEKMQRISIY